MFKKSRQDVEALGKPRTPLTFHYEAQNVTSTVAVPVTFSTDHWTLCLGYVFGNHKIQFVQKRSLVSVRNLG